MCDSSDVFLAFLAILFPPIAVWVKRGICSADSLINIALCCLGFLPGLLHAWYIISSYPDPGYEQVQQEERVVYVVHGTQYGTVTPQGQFPGQQSGSTNAFTNTQPKRAAKMAAPAPNRQPQAAAGSSSAAPADGAEAAAANSSNPNAPPPSYAAAVAGDHKIQN